MSYGLVVCEKTLFFKLDELYPECNFLIEDEPKLHPLICLVGTCHRNSNCMEKLVNRLKWLFDQFPKVELILLYFKYRDRLQSIRAGVFNKEFDEPRLIVMNQGGWSKMKELGIVYELHLPDSLFLSSPEKLTTRSLPVIND